MRLAKLLLLLVLPAIVWNAPLCSNEPPPAPKKLSPWDFLSYENLTYDNISTFVMNIMYEESSTLDSLWSVDETAYFVAHLARQGLPSWDTESQAELERDIGWLLDDSDNSDLENEPYWLFSSNTSQAPVYLTLDSSAKPQVLLCGGWLSNKWKKTKKFTKKHAKTIIIATAVVVVGTAVILLSKGTATPAVVAGAKAALDNDREPINKAGEVRFKDAPSPPSNNHEPPISQTPQNNERLKELASQISQPIEIPHIKDILYKELQYEPLNILPEEQQTFTEKAISFARETGSYLSHESIDTISGFYEKETTDNWHGTIDEYFGTHLAEKYTKEPNENEPQIAMGKSPFGGTKTLVTQVATTVLKNKAVQETTKNLLKSTTAVGTAAATSTLTQSSINKQVDLSLPKTPEALLQNSNWKEISHTKAIEKGHRTFENIETGEKLRYDEGKPGEPGHEGSSHWHRYNPNKRMGRRDEYLDADNNPVPRNSEKSHLYSPETD